MQLRSWPKGRTYFGAIAAAGSLLLSSACFSAGPQLEVLVPIVKDGVVVSCSMNLSAVLKRLAEFADGDKDSSFSVVILSREPGCSSNDYKFSSNGGVTVAVAFKKVGAPNNKPLSPLILIVPDDPRLSRACSEVNKLRNAVCVREASKR